MIQITRASFYFGLLGALLWGVACSSPEGQKAEANEKLQTAEALFAFAPKETEVAIAIRNVDLFAQHLAGVFELLSRVPSIEELRSEIEHFGEDKLQKSPFDKTFLSGLYLAPENGAALFVVDKGGRPALLGVVAIRETQPFLAAVKEHSKALFGEEMSVEKRGGDNPDLYDVSIPGTKIPNLVAAFKNGFLLLSEHEDLVKTALAQSDNPVWEVLKKRSPYTQKSHDALFYLNFDGKGGEEIRREYGSLPLGGEFIKSWESLTISLRIKGEVIRAEAFLSTPMGKDLRPYFERNGGRGDLLSIASQETVSSFRLTTHPERIWRKINEIPTSSDASPTRFAESFRGMTGVRFSDKDEGILENLTGEIAYVSGPGLIDFALLIGINRPEPFEKLLASLWDIFQTRLPSYQEDLDKARIRLTSEPPREEAGRMIYRLEISHEEIPIPLIIEAGNINDAVVFAVGEGWLDQASSRVGKSANAYYKQLYHPEERAIFAEEPQAVAYVQFLDPAEGLESTPGELAQTIAAYAKDPSLGEALSISRTLLERLYNGMFALFVRENGIELLARITTM